MIVTKQRKSLQPSSPYTRGEKYRYTNDDQESLLRDYHPDGQSMPINYGNRQRHSFSTVSPISKDRQNCFNSYSKKTQKKYDYSINLDHSIEKQHLNKTHDHANEKYRYKPQMKGQTYKVDFILEEYDRRRVTSVNQSSSKYHSTDGKSRPIFKPSQPQSINKQIPQQKVDIKTYLKNYEPKYDSVSKVQQKKANFTSSKQNDSLARKPLMSQNFVQDNFGATDKFKEFKNQNPSNQFQDSKNKPKYEPKYAGMRNNKRYQITKQEPQNERPSLKQDLKENRFTSKPMDLEKLLKDSNTQNSKIVEKINRIQKLNQQINKRLQSMLHRKQVS